MVLTDLNKEFQELMEIAQSNLLDRQTHDMTIDQFLQLCLDMRNAERGGQMDLTDKNLVILERNVIQ